MIVHELLFLIVRNHPLQYDVSMIHETLLDPRERKLCNVCVLVNVKFWLNTFGNMWKHVTKISQSSSDMWGAWVRSA